MTLHLKTVQGSVFLLLHFSGRQRATFVLPPAFFLSAALSSFIPFEQRSSEETLLDSLKKKRTKTSLPTTLVRNFLFEYGCFSHVAPPGLIVLRNRLYAWWWWWWWWRNPFFSFPPRSIWAVSELTGPAGSPLPLSFLFIHKWSSFLKSVFSFFFFFSTSVFTSDEGNRGGASYWIWLGVLRRWNAASDLFGGFVEFKWFVHERDASSGCDAFVRHVCI